MFTGIITELGKISRIKEEKNHLCFEVDAKVSIKGKKVGESIAVDGVCVTITSLSNKSFCFQLMKESLNVTNFAKRKINDEVNLEPAVTLTQSLDGHMVQGHIDSVAEVLNVDKYKSQFVLTLKIPTKISKYIALKGSISINGVSLTVSDLQKNTFSVALIPHTLQKTNLGKLKKGDKVNVEVDIIARYLERLLK